MASEETVYCLCRQPYDETRFMIECNVCKDWFHGTCVDIQEYQAADIEIYHCPNCQISQGPLLLKKRRNWHRHDYSESDDSISKAVQTGTVMFVKELKCRTFPSADQIPLLRLHGSELTVEYLQKNGFDLPILVEKVDGLNVKLPRSNFSIQDVENHVGSMREIDVIDVARQEDYKMLMREWTEYYASPNRHKILNVISLEFTNTKLSELVDPPQIVRDLSWVSTFWPGDQPPEDIMFHKPEVQRYCLMGVKDSFTDFHIDFGGTSVWYHVLRGEKIFYMIKPTPSNLSLYENWVSSCRQSEMFFGDQVDVCYRCVIKQGQTVFIPTGWIHAVLTPIDSLVFGGNFLHSLNIDLQIRIYEIEKAVDTPEKFMFPNFETVHWYAAKNIYDTIHEYREMGKTPPTYLVSGLKALVTALKLWTNKKEYVKRDSIPETIQYGRLLKELQKEVKHLTQSAVSSVERKPKQKGSGTQAPVKDENTQHTHKAKKKKKVKQKPDSSKPKAKSASAMDKTKTKTKMKVERAKHDANVENKHVGDIVIPKIKVRLPKADISIYDFDDDDNSIGGGIIPKVENEVKPSPLEVKQPAAKSSAKSTSAGLKLKMSGGKIVTKRSTCNSKSICFNTSMRKSNSGSQELSTTPPKSSHTGRFQLLGGGSAVKKESLSEFDSDNSDDQLVVDETPRKRKRENKSASTIKPGSLKLKLSVNRTPVSSAGVGGYPNPLDRFGSFPNSQESLTFGTGVPKEEGAAVGKPGPGTNGSIADILQAASTYSSGSHVSSAKSPRIPSLGETSDTSPSMQDAIQGMLCMSQMGGSLTIPSASPPGHSTLGWTSPGRLVKPTTPQKYVYDDDGIDKMPTCYKDDEFVYPTLDTSDTEDPHVFKPRGKQKRDDTWNPKAKLQPNCPKPERPQRQGTRRESVESGLAAAAAKLANAPMAKRQYIRHKPKQDKPSYSTLLNPQPGTSSTNKLASASDSKRSHITTPESPPKAVKKARKGMATAKQRLGRILKMHKMIH